MKQAVFGNDWTIFWLLFDTILARTSMLGITMMVTKPQPSSLFWQFFSSFNKVSWLTKWRLSEAFLWGLISPVHFTCQVVMLLQASRLAFVVLNRDKSSIACLCL